VYMPLSCVGSVIFESLDVQTSFLVHKYILRICRSASSAKVKVVQRLKTFLFTKKRVQRMFKSNKSVAVVNVKWYRVKDCSSRMGVDDSVLHTDDNSLKADSLPK